jgi:hypothetical protein
MMSKHKIEILSGYRVIFDGNNVHDVWSYIQWIKEESKRIDQKRLLGGVY